MDKKKMGMKGALPETQFLKLLRVAMTSVNLAPGLYPGSPSLRTLLSLSPPQGRITGRTGKIS